ncbi:hypothetical protein BJF85_21150 [Saccharomonospora sp. CUA-673]|uniref:WXG100 family type VII secretion target n=1 Tax=Saccharomonospora sp. CUA-673 TaxID=1904969 RepID=UPI000962B0CA|nr:WXG100 family type VII secretion target [Saccharomonospora sp. CUA-673]OLT43742.1 hypothetical protein BJF85_21150 [Saccharomonospora sp. CUA-673]
MSDAPSAQLTEPTASDPIPDLVENVIGASQYISVSYWVGEALGLITGVNPGEWAAEKFAGDFETVQKAGVAVGNLAKFNEDFAAEIRTGLTAVGEGWAGNAHDAAGEYFTKVADTIAGQIDVLDGLSKDIETVAVGMYEAAKAVKGFLEQLLDLAIAIGLELAAAAASSWTVIGPILAGAAAAATITKAIGVWGQALTAHTTAWNSCQAFVGIVAGYLGALDDAELQALPESNYNHPGVD